MYYTNMTDDNISGFSLKRLLTPPRAIRKLQPLKLLGKIAQPALGVLTGGIGTAIGMASSTLMQSAKQEGYAIAQQIPEVQQAGREIVVQQVTDAAKKYLPFAIAGVALFALMGRRR